MAANSSDTSSAAKPPQGVYKNLRLMHACTTIVGSTVHLQTKDGSIWEGILSTFSPEFTICLDYAVQIDPKLTDSKGGLFSALKSGSQVKKQAFFDLKDIVRVSAHDVDLSYATKEANAKLVTDSDISGYDANKSSTLGEQRQLESWQDDEGDGTNDDSMLSLDDITLGSSNKNDGSQNEIRGWDAQDMFRYNERVHKVTTTYDDKLTDYTLPLQKHSTKEWRKKQERAAAIAKEIEGNTKSQNRLAKEDENDDEEEKYSAVLRPNPRPQPALNKAPVESPDGAHEEIKMTGPGLHRPLVNRQNGAYKTYRTQRFDRSRVDSLKNFGKQLNLAPSPRQPRNPNPPQSSQNSSNSPNQTITQTQRQQKPSAHQQTSHQASASQSPHDHHQQQQQSQQSIQRTQLQSPHQQQQPQSQSQQQTQSQPEQTQSPQRPQPQQQQSQLQQQPPLSQQQPPQLQQQPPQPQQQQTQSQQQSQPLSTPPSNQQSQHLQQSQDSTSSPAQTMIIESSDPQSEIARKSKLNPNAKEFKPNSSSPMSQVPQAPYYQPVPMIPLGLSPHQQQYHAAQFMPNHTHPHFQNQIHYMSPVPHFQQMPQRYVRGNFQNYHRGEHHNNGRPDYSQASMMAPTSTGHPFVPSPSGAPHPMNAYAASQQAMIYSAPPQSMYPVVQAGFPQHMPHVMSNPPAFDGSAMYGVPSQSYTVNPQ